ncbi:response regulator [Rhodovastum atsumiense]|uniref:Response regulator n=2 Tax=Rhodovastum atsumiense TaxID=504468 RepID=A0A5M6INS1_9PROT|nr:response regulator [Rhodovastum atsumiense]
MPAGWRVLVVEDRSLIAGKVVRVLQAAGCIPVGPMPTLAAGEALVGTERLDAAVLDIDLRGEAVYPLAELLRRHGVPLLFLTGYGQAALPQAWQGVPLVAKPFEPAVLLAALGRLRAGQPAPVEETACRETSSDIALRAWDTIRQSRNIVMETRVLREVNRTEPQ